MPESETATCGRGEETATEAWPLEVSPPESAEFSSSTVASLLALYDCTGLRDEVQLSCSGLQPSPAVVPAAGKIGFDLEWTG